LLVIAAGGTGGHMFPAQALAEEMLRRGWRVALSTDARGAGYAGGFPEAVRREVVRSASFARGGAVAKLAAPFRLAAGVWAAIRAFRRERPDCVAGFGGYPAFPAMAAAWLLGLPRLIHEQNGVLGRVNRLFARRVHALACGTWPAVLPEGVQGIPVGNPVRAAVAARAGAAYTPPGADGRLRLLVFGGSQGARVMRIVPQAVALLPEAMRARLEVAQQTRAEDHEEVAAAYRKLGVNAELRPFFDDMAERLAAAQLVICRSGASSVADITVIGRPAIFIPLAIAIRDEQSANAAPLVAAGAAEVIAESELTAERLAAHIAAILGDPERAARMAAAALALGRPLAAQDLADLVETIARGESP